MLEQLAKKDTQWRKIAYNICKDKSLADDLVQDMYLKLCESKKEINDFYVIIVLRNLFLDHIKQNKTISLDGFDLPDKNVKLELNDNEIDFIKSLKWYEKELLEISQDLSYRDIQKQYNINYRFVGRVITKTQKKWQDQKNNIKD